MSATGLDSAEGRKGRSTGARVGIVLLNLIAPGLGVLRANGLVPALALLAASFVLIGSAILLFRLLPDLGLGGFLTVAIGTLLLSLLIYATAMILSWHASREQPVPLPWHSKWYVLAIVAVAHFAAWFVVTEDRDQFGYRTFSVPSESMAPTLIPGDTFVARMREPELLSRGQIVLHDKNGPIFVQRVAGLPGDRIGMRNGKVVLNGVEVAQTPTGQEVPAFRNGMTNQEFAEQFPDEARPHRILDSGFVPMADDFEEVTVPAGHLFLLGDNRDDSADSRFNNGDFGVGFVPFSAIRGYPLFHLWPGGSRPSGTRIDD